MLITLSMDAGAHPGGGFMESFLAAGGGATDTKAITGGARFAFIILCICKVAARSTLKTYEIH